MYRSGLPARLAMLAAAFAAISSCSSHERIIIQNVNVVTMTSPEILENRDVVVRDGRIISIVRGGRAGHGLRDRVVEGNGGYLIPGLADMHVHLYVFDDGAELPLFIANGVTTIKDCNGRGHILGFRDEVEAGKRLGPRIFCATQTIRGLEDEPWKLVEQRYKQGCDAVKFYSYFDSRESFHKAMTEANRLGAWTVGHIPYCVGLSGAIEEGMDEIAHVEEICWEYAELDRDQDLAPDEWLGRIVESFLYKYGDMPPEKIREAVAEQARICARRISESGVVVSTTCHYAPNIKRKIYDAENFARTPCLKYLPADYFINLGLGREKHQTQFRGIEQMAEIWENILATTLLSLHEEGVLITAGTDAIWDMGLVPGFCLHEELAYFVGIGLSPYEALKLCTANAGEAARRMKGLMRSDFGTIEPGKRADLVLLDDNPLDDISNTRKIAGVMADGRWYPRETLARMIEFDPELHEAQLAIFEGCLALKDNDWRLLDAFLHDTPCDEGKAWVYCNRRAVELLTEALHTDGRDDKAREHFCAAVTANWDDVEFLNGISWNMGVDRRIEAVYPDAIRASTRALELNRHPAILDTLAWLYALSGYFDRAIEAIGEARSIDPENGRYEKTHERILEMQQG